MQSREKPTVYNWNKAETRIAELERENTRLVGEIIRLKCDVQYYKTELNGLKRKARKE